MPSTRAGASGAVFRVAPLAMPPGWQQLPGSGVALHCEGDPVALDFEEAGVPVSDSVARSVPKRQREFLAGRLAAASALAGLPGLGIGPHDLSAGEDRLPRWPAGVHGSISHTGTVAMCWVADAALCGGVGLDVEMLMADERGDRLGERIAPELQPGAAGARDIAAASGLSDAALLTLVFSAKESLFKALYPMVRRYMGFEAAAITGVGADLSTLTLQLTEDWSPQWRVGHGFELRCAVDAGAGRVVTLLQLPSVK